MPCAFEPGFLTDYCIAFLGCTAAGDVGSTDLLDPDNRVERSGLSLRSVVIVMRCTDTNRRDGCEAYTQPGELAMARARFRLLDSHPPVLSVHAGALATDGALLEGPQSVSVVASDVGSGVRRLLVLADGSVVADELGSRSFRNVPRPL